MSCPGKWCPLFLAALSFLFSVSARAQTGTDNPVIIPIAEAPAGLGDHFFAADVTGDGAFEFIFRSDLTLYVYSQSQGLLWSQTLPLETDMNGSTMGADDVDGDGLVEVVALNANDQCFVFNGPDGTEKRRFYIDVGPGQRAAYMQLVNLRGQGRHELLVQTNDLNAQGVSTGFYINRSLLAYSLEDSTLLWRLDQDDEYDEDDGNPWYEGYWGQTHGAFFAADMNSDGLDEVLGARWITAAGQAVDAGYPTDWLDVSRPFLDHLDAIQVGDYLPDRPGLEWALCEEDHLGHKEVGGSYWNTAIVCRDSVLWRRSSWLFLAGSDSTEPQNLALGRFLTDAPFGAVWNRSRFAEGQHPWVYDIHGIPVSHYVMEDKLPDGFGDELSSGIDMIWTIDWDGSGREYIAAKSRHSSLVAHAGVFDAVTGEPVWTTLGHRSQMFVQTLYVADISGDAREEITIVDLTDMCIKVFSNQDDFSRTLPRKWDDALYRRLKQNWCYYSPGGYTAREPLLFTVSVSSFDAHVPAGAVPLTSPFQEDRRVLKELPSQTVSWALLRLLTGADVCVTAKSVLITASGEIINPDGDGPVSLFAEKQNQYRLELCFPDGHTVQSESMLDLSGGSAQYHWSLSTAVAEPSAPRTIELDIFPNPFVDVTVLRIHAVSSGEVGLTIYNLMGQQVASLWQGRIPAPGVTLQWDGCDDSGHAMKSGIYMAVLKHGHRRFVQKLVLVR